MWTWRDGHEKARRECLSVSLFTYLSEESDLTEDLAKDRARGMRRRSDDDRRLGIMLSYHSLTISLALSPGRSLARYSGR